jgi:thioredoxin-dependent peroxiredoxin
MTLSKLIGHQAPAFRLENHEGIERTNRDYLGKWLILYFYPKDNTPGCTTEALAFTELKTKFSKKDAVIVGVSPDSVASHQKFTHKKSLNVELLSDTEKSAAEAFGVWQLKKMAGREYKGVVRTTFVISPDGIVKEVFEKVKVNGHVEAVFNRLCLLSE